MAGKPYLGHIPGISVKAPYANRAELHTAGVHRPLQAGISGSGTEGAGSIVISGGYEDDEDHGDVIIYTGHGGNDQETGQQIADQELIRGNLGLAKSCEEGLPVRVIRGARGNPAYAPSTGYRYDGLYHVEKYWPKNGRSGFTVWRLSSGESW